MDSGIVATDGAHTSAVWQRLCYGDVFVSRLASFRPR